MMVASTNRINNKIVNRAFNYILIQFTIPTMITKNKDEPTSPVRPSNIETLTPQKDSCRQNDNARFSTAATRRVLQDEGSSTKENKYTGCNCNKSQCLKMYCACFSLGKMCDQTCLCQSCKNDNDNMMRSEAINEVIVKDPYAFSRKHTTADFAECLCNCRKSFCQKKYCDCYRRGKQCGQSCQCFGCNNRDSEEKIQRSEPLKLTKVQ